MVDADRDELRRYREEEERGLLLHLPVPLGAAVWRVRENPACHYGVRQAEIFLFGEVVTPRRIGEETPFTLRLLERCDPQDEIYLSNKKEDRLRNPPIEQVYYT